MSVVAVPLRAQRPTPPSPRDFWGALSPQEQATLRASATTMLYDSDEAVVTEGITTEQVTIIRWGWAKATVSKAGRPVLLRLYGPGELVGVSAAVIGTAPSETVTTGRFGLHVMNLTSRRFTEFIRCAPGASAALHRLQQWRLEEAVRLRTLRDYPTSAQRMAGLLAELCRPDNHPRRGHGGILIVPGHLDLSQEELGSWIGDSRKTVVRALAELRQLGLVSTTVTRNLAITSPAQLRAFAEAADAANLETGP